MNFVIFIEFSEYKQHIFNGISRLRPSLNFNQFNNLYPIQNSQENIASTLNTLNDLFSTISSNITIQPINNSMRNIINRNINSEITSLLNQDINQDLNQDEQDLNQDINQDDQDGSEFPEINNFTQSIQNIHIDSNNIDSYNIDYVYNDNQSLANNLNQYFSNFNINLSNNNDSIYSNSLFNTINDVVSDNILNNFDDEYSTLINLLKK